MKQLPQLADYELPKSRALESEMILSCVFSPEYIFEVRKVVGEDYFFYAENKAIWHKLVELDDKHETIDASTFPFKVNSTYFFDMMGEFSPKSTISEIMELTYSLQDIYIKRNLYITYVNGLQNIQGGIVGENIKEETLNSINNINSDLNDKGIKTATALINEVADDLNKPYNTRIKTGISTLDFFTYGGLSGGKFVVLGARPAVGKTTIGLQIAQNAVKQNKNVLVFSTEMNGTELMQRLLFSTGLVTPYEFATKQVNWSNFERASAMVTSDRLHIVYGKIMLDEVLRKARNMFQQGKCDMILVDYIQNVLTNDKPNTPQAVVIGNITRELKIFANEYNIPIVGLAQLNRDSVAIGREPMIHDLKGSGAIEQDADLILMLDKGKDDTGCYVDNKIDMWIRKNRQGKVTLGEPIHLQGDENYFNFVEI